MVYYVQTTEGVFEYDPETDENFPVMGAYWFVDGTNMGRVMKVSTTKW